MRTPFLLLLSIVAVESSTFAQVPVPAGSAIPQLNQLMRPDEIKEMGLDKLAPGEIRKLEGWLARFKGTPPAPMLHYRFDGTVKNEVAGARPFIAMNTEFRENALYLNGVYDGNSPMCLAPALDYNKFTVALRFKAEEFGNKTSVVFVGGRSYRWFRMMRSTAGNLIVAMNQGGFSHEFKDTPLTPGAWTVVACGVDVLARKMTVYYNGRKAATVDLPPGFKFTVADSDAKDRDKIWTFADYSYGGMFHGLVDECIIYGEMLSDDEMGGIPLAPPTFVGPSLPPTAFKISSIGSAFGVAGELSGTYQSANGKLVVNVSDAKIVVQGRQDRNEVTAVYAMIAEPPKGSGGFAVPARSVDLAIGRVITKTEPFVLKNVTFEVPMSEPASAYQDRWLGFVFVVRSPDGSTGTCYAHMGSLLDGSRKR